MSPSAQAKFLRVLQEREFQRLGGTRLLKANVRIIAATNRDLRKAVERGDFREDLFYRLQVFDIRLAPLRERSSDIVLLSDGDATRGIIQNGKLAEWYATQWKQRPANRRPHTYIFAVGDDANMPLLRMLARNDGVLEWVRSTEPVDFKLNAFLAKIGRQPLENLQLTATPASQLDLVYALEDMFLKLPIHWLWWPAIGAVFVGIGGRKTHAYRASLRGRGRVQPRGSVAAWPRWT